jgi:hypothetical protein
LIGSNVFGEREAQGIIDSLGAAGR